MRSFIALAASVSILALAGCSSGADKVPAPSDKGATPPPPIAKSEQEEKELTALMGADTQPDNPTGIRGLMNPDNPMETMKPTPSPEPMAADTPPAPDVDPATAVASSDAAAIEAATQPAAEPERAPARKVAGAPQECPGVEVLPDTKSITYFDDPEGRPTGATVARASLVDIRGGCEYTEGAVIVDIDMIMAGRITDKGRYEGRKDLEAFMTFPYFVAIMDPAGKMIDKKIMATAMRFKPHVDDLDHAEKITQTIPLPDISKGPEYTITVGFQLNREQLEYNRGGSIAQDKPAGRASPPVPEPAREAPKAAAPETTPTPAKAPAAAGSGGTKMSPIVE